MSLAMAAGAELADLEFMQFHPTALRLDGRSRGAIGRDSGSPMLFPKVNSGINFVTGETQPTRRELDVAILALPLEASGLMVQPLYDEPFVVAVPRTPFVVADGPAN